MANLALATVAAQQALTGSAPLRSGTGAPAPVERERPVAPGIADRSDARSTGNRFQPVALQGQDRPAAQQQPDAGTPAFRENLPFLAQLFGQQTDRSSDGEGEADSRRSRGIDAYRRTQASIADEALIFDVATPITGSLGQQVDLIG